MPIIDSLSQQIKSELYLEIFGKAIRKIPAFAKNFSEATLDKLALKMYLKKYVPGEDIYSNNIY